MVACNIVIEMKDKRKRGQLICMEKLHVFRPAHVDRKRPHFEDVFSSSYYRKNIGINGKMKSAYGML